MRGQPKILIIANNDGGLLQFRGDLIKKMIEQRCEVFASCPNIEGRRSDIEKLSCTFIDTAVDRRGINPKTDLKLFLTYRKLLKVICPDLVITYTIKPNVYGGFASRLAGIPYASNITGLGTAFQNRGILKTFVTFLYKVSLRRAKVIFFENSENRNVFLRMKICRQKQTKLLHGAGVNLERFFYAPYPQEEATHFLFMGRIMAEKGVNELFAAMERLHADGENCVLDVLGRYEEDYCDRIDRYQKAGWLKYHGYQEDVQSYISKAHCFVLPSWHEGMANTNLECAAMGRPVITSNIPGCREAVIEGKSGYLCKARDADSVYQAMKTFMKLSREEREAMGKEGRQHMEAVFDKEKVVMETMKGLGI
ncbi:MAG: glycosyltransferase family 4 protein [Eubacteriales bacterium]|nr:glycosyltransferase family 4 protein [Eubacteriales bacterium]